MGERIASLEARQSGTEHIVSTRFDQIASDIALNTESMKGNTISTERLAKICRDQNDRVMEHGTNSFK